MKGQTLGAFVKLIVFAAVTIVLTGILTIVIQNRSFGATKTYKADFTSAAGLLSGDQVKIAGVRVGTVSDVRVLDDKHAQVTFTVDQADPVYASDDVDIEYLNLVGQRYIAIKEHAGSAQTQPEDVAFTTAHTAPSLDLTSLFNGFRPLFAALNPKAVNSFALELIQTLQGEGGTIEQLVAKSAQLTNNVADHDAVIGQVIDNLLTTLNTVQAHNAGLNQLIEQLQRLVTGLANQRHVIAGSLGNIDDLARNSAGLIAHIRPHLTTNIADIGKIANTLNTTKTCPGYFNNPGLMTNAELRRELQKHGLFANNNCKGPNTLEEFLQREPTKLDQITRTATYGSFFNFYLCDLNLKSSNLAISINAPACGDS
jgi:phospholipid/cholesterol/gamma-HCH transport system substrate-binding protein